VANTKPDDLILYDDIKEIIEAYAQKVGTSYDICQTGRRVRQRLCEMTDCWWDSKAYKFRRRGPIDKDGNTLHVGDTVAYVKYSTLRTGVILAIAPSGNNDGLVAKITAPIVDEEIPVHELILSEPVAAPDLKELRDKAAAFEQIKAMLNEAGATDRLVTDAVRDLLDSYNEE